MSNLKKICVVGSHGTGKTTICRKVFEYIDDKEYDMIHDEKDFISLAYIHEQFREIIGSISNFRKQTEEITLATYGSQLYLENLYEAQGKKILCDRSLLDTFIYYDYFNKYSFEDHCFDGFFIRDLDFFESVFLSAKNSIYFSTYYKKSKIYLIEPSEREIENDNFRLTDKKEQLEIHKLFLSYFKDFENVIIINQERQEEIVEMIIEDLK